MKIAANKKVDKKEIKADEEVFEEVEVADEAIGLLFEAEDVAELVAEITGEPVEVTGDTDEVVFAIGEDEFVVTPEGDEEILEAVRKPLKGKRPVKAAERRPVRRPLARRPIKEACHGEKKEVKGEEKKEVKASRTIKKFPKTSK